MPDETLTKDGEILVVSNTTIKKERLTAEQIDAAIVDLEKWLAVWKNRKTEIDK